MLASSIQFWCIVHKNHVPLPSQAYEVYIWSNPTCTQRVPTDSSTKHHNTFTQTPIKRFRSSHPPLTPPSTLRIRAPSFLPPPHSRSTLYLRSTASRLPYPPAPLPLPLVGGQPVRLPPRPRTCQLAAFQPSQPSSQDK